MRRRAIIGKSKGGGVPGTGFKMQIQTTTANEVFTLPTDITATYNATVLWGDGTQSSVTGHNVNNAKTYATAGTYDIEIKGTFDSLYFNNSGSRLLVKKILSWGGDDFAGFNSCYKMLYGCTNLNSLSVGGIKYKSGANISMKQTFMECSSLVNIPGDLFINSSGSMDYSFIFYKCTNLVALPAGLFDNCLSMTLLSNAFRHCSNLQTIPNNLFANNLNLVDLGNAFGDCSSLATLPPDLFKYNTAINSFGSTFNGCTNLTTLPADLFRYNTAVTYFNYTFNGCPKLQLRSDIFGATPDFGTRVMNFSSCFERTIFTGTQGTAPALWNATMNASSIKTKCFYGAGNSATSLTNYADIPAAWK